MKKLVRAVSFVLLFSIVSSSVFAQELGPAGKPSEGGPQIVPDQILLRFRPGIPPQRADQVLAEKGLTRLRRIPVLGVDVLQLPPSLTAEEALEVFSRRPDVDYAEPNYILTALAIPVELQDQWGLAKIQAPAAWNEILNPATTLLATVDTGIDRTHPDLSVNIWQKDTEVDGQPGFDDDGNGYVDDVWGWDFVNNDNDPVDDNIHGTLVSSVAAAVQDDYGVAGVCPWCQLMSVKVLGSDGSGTLDMVASGIVYAADNDARVINLSLAGIIGSATLENAVNYAWNQGSLVVAAAGNNGANMLVYPAAYPNAMSVASTNSQDFRSCFSNYGDNYISVAAPGEAVTGALPGGGYGTYSGTSLAAPHVTGLAGLLYSQDPSRTNSQVRALIQDTSNDLGPDGPDAFFGAGRINAYRAVRKDTTPTSPPAGLFSDDATASGYAHARKLARDANGDLHLVWHTKNGNQYRVMFATSTNDGISWSQEVVFESSAETYHPALALSNQSIYLAFPSKHNSSLYRIFTTSKSLSGGNWSAPVAAIGGNYNAVRPDLYFEPGSAELHLVASSFDDAPNVYYTASQDGGSTWGPVQIVNIVTGAGQRSRYVDVHASGANLYLAGRSVEFTFFGLVPHYRLFYVRSADRGISWSSPQVLAEFGDLFSGSGEYGLSLSGVGDRLFLAYEHAGDIQFRRSEDGINWSVPQLIGPGTWPSIAQLNNGESWLAWVDSGNINLRRYDGSAWGTSESKGIGTYPNLKADNSGGSVDWVSTQCSGAPFRLSVSGQATGSNQLPIADPGGPYAGMEDLAVFFDGTTSSDPDGDQLSYSWDFGDGASGNGATPSHVYTYGGAFTVSLTVTDGRGGVSQATTIATISEVNDLPVADAGGPYSGEVGSPVTFDGSASYDPDNHDGTSANDQNLAYNWDFGDGSSGSGINPAHTYTTAGNYAALLTVSDGVDASTGTAQVTISSVNRPPVANDVVATGPEGSEIPWTPSVSDPDDDPLACSIVDHPADGEAAVDEKCGPGLYSPDPGFNGLDTFTYRACETSTSGGLCSPPATVTITVNPVPGVHIGDLDAASISAKRFWTAQVTVTVHDGNHVPVLGATVDWTWNGSASGSGNCTTNVSGQCMVEKFDIRKNIGSITFTVTSVAYGSSAYQPSANHDPDGDSDGTTIVVSKP